MSQIIDQINEMQASPEIWADVLEATADSILTESESSRHSISGFAEDILEHLSRMIQLGEQASTPKSKIQAHRKALELIQTPALLLDASGTVIEGNRLLSHFLYEDAAITLGNERLQFQACDQHSKFEALLLYAQANPGMQRDTFHLETNEQISISIFHSRYPDTELFTLLFSRNLLNSSIALNMVVSAFALSKQEALLSLQLASGKTVKQAAHAIGVSYETARGYLKSIFAKTNCNNQLMLAFKIHDACLPQTPEAIPASSNSNAPTLTPEMIMASFSLSRQEARLALEMVSGAIVKQAAHTVGISYETARGYLKSIYAKTDCNSQTALVLKIQHECLPLATDIVQEHSITADVDATYTLKNGRILSYCIYGPPDGYPLVIHHTICGSRKQMHHDIQMLQRHQIKAIIVDRPGYGSSTYYDERKLHDWPHDLEQLLDHLEIEHFALLGMQYGAEYALACSQYFGSRVSSTQLVSMQSPPELLPAKSPPEFSFMQKNMRLIHQKGLSAMLLKNAIAARIFQQTIKFLTHKYADNPLGFFRQMSMFKSVKDLELIGSEARLQEHFNMWLVAYAQTEGLMMVKDVQIVSSPWQIDFAAIRQPVHIWHSRHDPQALFPSVENLLQYFDKDVVELHVIEDDSVMTSYHYMEEIIAQVKISL